MVRLEEEEEEEEKKKKREEETDYQGKREKKIQ